MVQDAVLLESTQHELRHIVNRRKRKLQELYHVTCATVDSFRRLSVNVSSSSYARKASDETNFLETNDVEKGRFFDVATLRRLPGADQLFSPLPPVGKFLEHKFHNAGKAPGSEQRTKNLVRDTSQSSGQAQENPEAVTPLASVATSTLQTPTRLAPTEDASRDTISTENNPSRPSNLENRELFKPSNTTSKSGSEVPVTPRTEGADDGSANTTNLPAGTQFDAQGSSGPVSSANPLNSTPESQLLFETAQSRRSSVPSDTINNAQDVQKGGGLADDPSRKAVSSANMVIKSQIPAGISTPTSIVERSPKPVPKYPMQIDTSIARQPAPQSHTASAASTPPISAHLGQASPPERPRTRVSSGALRHKSVSEILGETPRTSSVDQSPVDKTAFSPAASSPISRRYSQASGTLESGPFGRRLSDLRDKEKARSQLSTVIFTKPQGDYHQESQSRSLAPAKKSPYDGIDDYLLPLFLAQAGHQELIQLINSSRKSLSTDDFDLYIRELMNCRLLKKIYVMQNNGKWSLRQHEREPEPERPTTRWDALLAEMRWMRTDFREERKWKLAICRNLACSCAEWVAADAAGRKVLQVKTKQRTEQRKQPQATPDSGAGITHDHEEPVPELVHSAGDDTSEEAEEDMRLTLTAPPPPAAVFSLGANDVLFGMDLTPVRDKLLSELPLYDPFAALRIRSQGQEADGIDGAWRKSITPVSKWNDSRIVFKEEPPNKRRRTSRFDYAAEEEPQDRHIALAAEKTDVAMFRPENRHLMHRLHQTHAFRMPSGSEFPLPSQAFFEYRQSSQWTREDDEHLRRRVREYAFNWSLISQTMSSNSHYTSGAERRTPWECFERWEGMEGIPQEYAKYEFFKRWQSRKQHAEQRQEELYQAQQQHAAAAPIPHNRRRTGKPVTVERRKSNRYAGLFMAMSKYAKKKEAQQAKQQQLALAAASRKPPEPQQSQKRLTTPAELSAHKHKQELEIAERQRMLRAQYAQKQAAMARNNFMAGHPHAQQSIPQINRGSMPTNGAIPHLPSSVPANVSANTSAAAAAAAAAAANAAAGGQGRLLPHGQGMMNNIVANSARPPNMQQGQMQSFRQGQGGLPDNARVMAEANRMQEQQRFIAQSRQYPSANGPHPMPSGLPQQSNTFTAIQQQTGKLSPAINGQRPVSSSNRVPQLAPGQQLSSGVTPAINHIVSELKKRHPNLPDANISVMATQQLNLQLQNNRAAAGNAMHPANGHNQQNHSNSLGQHSFGVHEQAQKMAPNTGTPGQMATALNAYSAAVRMATQQQSNAQAANPPAGSLQNGTPRPESRGMVATPQNPSQSRTNTATPTSASNGPGGPGSTTSQSPRPSSAQVQSVGKQ